MRQPNPSPHLIASSNELWTGNLTLRTPIATVEIQKEVIEYVTESGITVVGYHTEQADTLTLLRWPDSREGYHTPTVKECNIALGELAVRLHAQISITDIVVPNGKIHVATGRKVGGYTGVEIASLSALQAVLPEHSITEAHMVSARTGPDGIEPYNEEVGIIVADPTEETTIHQLADKL